MKPTSMPSHDRPIIVFDVETGTRKDYDQNVAYSPLVQEQGEGQSYNCRSNRR
jgi:hypothetical protein